jgi:hypothetical protein
MQAHFKPFASGGKETGIMLEEETRMAAQARKTIQKPNVAAYRRRKNAKLWALITQYGDVLRSRDVLPLQSADILKQQFGGAHLGQLTEPQRARFWKACAEALVRAHVRAKFGTEHISELSGAQLMHLAEDVEAMLHGRPVDADDLGSEVRADRPITAEQRATIREMYALMGWKDEQRKGYNQRIIKKDAPETRGEANKMIRAIQALFLHQLDLKRFIRELAFCRQHWVLLDSYKRQIVEDAERKTTRSGTHELTMGLVRKVYESIEHIQIHLQRKAARRL